MAKISRFYFPSKLAINAKFDLPNNIVRHVITVLRLQIGEKITLFDGYGGEYLAVIINLSRNSASVKVEKHFNLERESSAKIILLQSIQTSDKMDYSIQKATELGVHKIIPILGQRSISRLSGERAEKRIEHWRGIIISACEQSGRNYLPEIHQIVRLADYLPQINDDSQRFYCHPNASNSLAKVDKNIRQCYLALGAEGGFSDEEINLFKIFNFTALSLGSRILRTETATVTAIAVLQAQIGDLQ